MYHRMADMIAADSIAEMFGVSFGREPWTMDANDQQFIRIFVGEVVKVRDNMLAVQRTIGIEIEQYDPAFLLAQPDRTVDVEPVQLVWNFRKMTLFLDHGKNDPGMLPVQPCS
jgi:hypothetical protein